MSRLLLRCMNRGLRLVTVLAMLLLLTSMLSKVRNRLIGIVQPTLVYSTM